MKIHKITSHSNEKIKYIKKLTSKRARDKASRFLVENLRIIHDAIKAGYKPVSFFITEEMLEKDKNDERLKYIFDNLEECFLINNEVNKHFSSLTSLSGICAVFDKQEREINFNKKIIYLNDISDPGNLGTILRTAVAFDIENIVVDSNCADIYNAKTISAAKDAILNLNIAYDKNFKLFNKIKSEMKVYSTNLRGGSGMREIKKDEQFCIVFGNEANGVSEEILEKSDGFLKIKMSDNMESLNVAISAGIIFYELYNK